MAYIEDLEACILSAEAALEELEKCYKNKYFTTASITKLKLNGTLKSVKFCIACANRKAKRKDIPVSEFECVGGCIRPGIFEKFQEYNKKLWYVNNLTRLDDKRYDPETGLFLGNCGDFWEDRNENTEE